MKIECRGLEVAFLHIQAGLWNELLEMQEGEFQLLSMEQGSV